MWKLNNMLAILGKKIGMSQFIKTDGKRIPVTILEAGPCLVTEVRTLEKNGYKAAQIGYGEIKEKHTTKAFRTQLQKKKLLWLKLWLEIKRLPPRKGQKLLSL